jgi:hypothetical protein
LRCKEITKRPEGLISAPIGYYEERFSGKEVFDECNFIQDGVGRMGNKRKLKIVDSE